MGVKKSTPTTVCSRPEHDIALRESVRRLSENADEPEIVAAALCAIRKFLRTSPEGPAWVVQVRFTLLFALLVTVCSFSTFLPSAPGDQALS